MADAGMRSNGRWQYGSVESDGSVASDSAKARLREAGLVIDHAPDLAADVISEEMALDAASVDAFGEARALLKGGAKS